MASHSFLPDDNQDEFQATKLTHSIKCTTDEKQEDAFQSHYHSEKTTDTPLIHVMALHALAYCERLFYLEEVEGILLADGNVYAGRQLHDDLDKGPDIYTVELASERLGIRGKMDCVRRKSGELVVYEHKRGKSKHGTDAWPSDVLQITAYALLLSENTGETVHTGYIRYHADNKTISIPIDRENAEEMIRKAITKANLLRSSLERPPITQNEKLCSRCSLSAVCLPEEERFVESRQTPKRFFPETETRRIIHVIEQGASIHRSGEQLVVYTPDGSKKHLPGMAISAIVLHGNVQISAQSIHFCAANEIGVHWLSFGGAYIGAIYRGTGKVQRHLRQYQAMSCPRHKMTLALRLVQAKIENQLKYILRSARGKPDKQDAMEKNIARLRDSLRDLSLIEKKMNLQNEPSILKESVSTIRGHEGMAGKIYFSLLPFMLNVLPGDLLSFQGRNRRPPKDPFNALLSFGYALLYRDCVNALLSVGLDPSIGFFHTPRSSAHPLALDLMELFRVILWDVPLIGSVNRKQWQKEDFSITTGQVWLNVQGRRKAIQLYENRKQEKWKHPVLQYSLSYARTIELEARLLEKEWMGQTNLFAKLRLR